jgi:nucleoside-diphosphate-sugar epimerase
LNLITGVTGLVGAHVALVLLKENKPVVALRRKGSDIVSVKKLFSYYDNDPETLFNKIIWKEGDVTDVFSLEEALGGIETVYHCAGFVSMDDKDEKEMFLINKTGTANMVNAALNHNIKRFCHVSSIAAIQNADASQPLNETVFWKSGSYQSAYSVSKYLAEQEVWRGMEEGLKAVIVNPGVIIGPGFWTRGSGKLFTQSLKGIKFYTEGRTGFVGAMDVARLMVALTEQEKFGERYVLIENNYTFREILEKIHAGLNRTLPSVKAGSLLLNTARLAGFLMPGRSKFTKATITSALSNTSYSNQKLLANLSYNFQSLNDCISFTCQALLREKQS